MTSASAPRPMLFAILPLRIRIASVMLLTSLRFGSTLNAQPLDFQMGSPTEIKLKGQQVQILGEVKEKYLVLTKESGSGFVLTTMGKDLTPFKSLKINFPVDVKLNYQLKSGWLSGEKIIILSHCFNKALRQDQYHWWELSIDGFLVKGPIEAVRVNGNGIVTDPQNSPVFGCSRDQKVLYAIFPEPAIFGQSLAGIRCKQWDTELELLCNKTLNLSVENQTSKILNADFRDANHGLVNLNLSAIPKPGIKSLPAAAMNQRLCKISVTQSSIINLPINTEEYPYIHQVNSRWSDDSQNILAVSSLSGSFKSGIQTLLLQKWNVLDTTPIHRHTFAVPASFKKNAEQLNKKFRDTGTPKRVLKEVMDLRNQIVEIDRDRFTVFGCIERVNREVAVGKKADEVANQDATYTHYAQGNLVLQGTWSQGIQRNLENPMDQIIQPKGMPLPTGIAGLSHPAQVLMIYNDLPENMVVRNQAFKVKGMNNENLKDAKTVLLHVDADGRFSFFKPFSNPKDQGKIYPNTLFLESNHSFVFVGSDPKGMMRLVRASY